MKSRMEKQEQTKSVIDNVMRERGNKPIAHTQATMNESIISNEIEMKARENTKTQRDIVQNGPGQQTNCARAVIID